MEDNIVKNNKESVKIEANTEFNLAEMSTLEIITRCGALRYSLA